MNSNKQEQVVEIHLEASIKVLVGFLASKGFTINSDREVANKVDSHLVTFLTSLKSSSEASKEEDNNGEAEGSKQLREERTSC
jgi:hypothetical protein